MAMLKRALAALMLVLVVAPCSGQPMTSSGVELYPGCGCLGDNSKLGELQRGSQRCGSLARLENARNGGP